MMKPGSPPARVDARGRLERRARAAWRSRPGPLLRTAAALYGSAMRARGFLYETGVLAAAVPVLPVVSVGGLTVGGSGKTPLTAALASIAEEEGFRPAVVTRGFPDELALHARLGAGRVVVGHPDRERAVRRAAELGAEMVFLDDGFQHRRLARRLDLVAVDADFAGRHPWRLLPAGPFRESPAALARADAVIVTRRESGEDEARSLADWIRRRTGVPLVVRCALEPDGLRGPGGEPAPDARPGVALAGIMKPEAFFGALRLAGHVPALEVTLPDHGLPEPDLLRRIVAEARPGGVATTAKDAARLAGRLPADVPLWILEERLTWEEGLNELRARLRTALLAEPGTVDVFGEPR